MLPSGYSSQIAQNWRHFHLQSAAFPRLAKCVSDSRAHLVDTTSQRIAKYCYSRWQLSWVATGIMGPCDGQSQLRGADHLPPSMQQGPAATPILMQQPGEVASQSPAWSWVRLQAWERPASTRQRPATPAAARLGRGRVFGTPPPTWAISSTLLVKHIQNMYNHTLIIGDLWRTLLKLHSGGCNFRLSHHKS